MIYVAFVCLGNICRSPMAELIFKDMVFKEGISGSFAVDSFGTSDYEVGEPIHPSAKRELAKHGIYGSHTAKQITLKDIINNDYILVMDNGNFFDILAMAGDEYGEKVKKLGEFCEFSHDIADPWFTLNFTKAYEDILEGCRGFLKYVMEEKREAIEYDKRH